MLLKTSVVPRAAALSLLMLLAALAACGQKGPLELPAAATPTAPAAQPAPASAAVR
jgi:predicted small lipoprotein YifL